MIPGSGPVGMVAAAMPRRAAGVTVIGVLFLSLGMAWLFAALFQGAFFAFLASMRPGGIGLGELTNDPNVPVAMRFILHYAKLFWVLNIVASGALCVASIGLLRRKNWARVAFVGVGVLGIVYALVSLGASALMVPFFRSQMAGLESLGVGTALATMATMALAIVVVKSVFVAVFFGWMVRKLTRAEVREEFG